MPDPIANCSPEAVIEAIEDNLIDASVSLGRTEDGVVFRGSDVTWVYTGYRELSRVMRARFSPDEAEDRVAEIAECFRQWNAPVAWFIGPSSFPPELGECLRDSGFSTNEVWAGMATDLAAVPAVAPTAPLRVELVTETAELQAWATLSTESWSIEPADGATNIFSPENAGGDPRCRYYLGYLGSKPVVRGMACVRGETAGLHWLSILPEHRQSGYDIALASRALIDARDSGSRLGVMPIRHPNQPLAAKLGFKQYCQFNVYAWPAIPPKAPVC
jgi:hypothetical protein